MSVSLIPGRTKRSDSTITKVPRQPPSPRRRGSRGSSETKTGNREATLPETSLQPVHLASHSPPGLKVVSTWRRTTPQKPKCRTVAIQAVGCKSSGKKSRDEASVAVVVASRLRLPKLPWAAKLEGDRGKPGVCHAHRRRHDAAMIATGSGATLLRRRRAEIEGPLFGTW